MTQVWYVSGLQVAQRNKFFIHDHKCVNLFHYINFHRNIPNLCQFYSSTVLRHIRKRPTSIRYRKQFLAILAMCPICLKHLYLLINWYIRDTGIYQCSITMKLVFGVVILCLLFGTSMEEMLKGSYEGWDANGNQVYRFQLWRLWDWDKPFLSGKPQIIKISQNTLTQN